MTVEALVASAESARVFGGSRIRPLNGLVLTGVAMGLGAVAAAAVGTVLPYGGWLAGLGVMLVAYRVLMGRHNGGIAKINDGVKLITAGDYDGAERVLVPIATGRYTITCATYAIYNLGTVALRRGDMTTAIALYRAALALYKSQRIVGLRAGAHIARSGLAFAYASTGQLDLAERTLAEPIDVDVPQMLASETITRALVALRRDKPETALVVLDTEKRLLRSAVAGDATSLQLAIEAVALHKLGGVFAGQPRTAARVPVDAEARAYVLRALPGCEAFLAPA